MEEAGSEGSVSSLEPEADDRLDRAKELIFSGTPAFDEQVFVVARGSLEGVEAIPAAVGFDEEGRSVLIASLAEPSPSAAAQLADAIDHMAQLPAEEITRVVGVDEEQPGVWADHANTFDLSDPLGSDEANRDQRAIVVVAAEPTAGEWTDLIIELGKHLAGIYSVTDGDTEKLNPPDELLRRPRSRGGPWTFGTWVGIVAVVAGVALGTMALVIALRTRSLTTTTARTVDASVTSLAGGVEPDATHTQWIGQRRVVRTTEGQLLAFYPSAEGLTLVPDAQNGGRSWGTPSTIPDIQTTSFSVASDSRDRIHVVYVENGRCKYALLRRSPSGYELASKIAISGEGTTQTVGVTWNRFSDSAHAIWGKKTGEGEQLRWAALEFEAGVAIKQASRPLTDFGDQTSILANIASAKGGRLLVSYRKSSAPFGWYSREGRVDREGVVNWGAERKLPTDSIIGAATLAIDSSGIGHLVLRDSSEYGLLYFQHTSQDGWAGAETVEDVEATDQIDLPTLTVDRSSRIVYLLFQSTLLREVPEILVSVRDPASGWEGPYRIADVPEGALGPMAPAVAQGAATVVWTTGGASPAMQSARVLAP